MSAAGVSSRSAAMKARWADPEFRQRMVCAIKHRMALVWADPEFRERRTEAARIDMTRRMAMPDYSARAMQALDGSDAQTRCANRAKSAAKLREKWSDPEWREKRRAELRAAMLERLADPVMRANMIEKRRARGKLPPSRKVLAKRIARAVAAGVIVPGWVPADLADTYLAIAGQRNEIAAAAEIRRIKRERGAA